MTHYDAVDGWVLRLCKKPAWDRKFPPLEPPAQWCAFLLMPSSFFSYQTLARLLRLQRGFNNSVDDRWSILALITALTIDKVSISTALSKMHTQQ